ncbi:MAG: NAD(P)H-dependent oxidoreductase subunit E, partial [Clostridiales bacterium]
MMTDTQTMSRSRQFSKVCEILERYSYDSTKLIPILQAVQEEYRYLPEEVLTFVATSLNLSPARVYGVATFYSHFALQAKGKYLIRVCDGTACHVKGSVSLIEVIQEKLGLDEKKRTTPDMLFTLETV